MTSVDIPVEQQPWWRLAQAVTACSTGVCFLLVFQPASPLGKLSRQLLSVVPALLYYLLQNLPEWWEGAVTQMPARNVLRALIFLLSVFGVSLRRGAVEISTWKCALCSKAVTAFLFLGSSESSRASGTAGDHSGLDTTIPACAEGLQLCWMLCVRQARNFSGFQKKENKVCET